MLNVMLKVTKGGKQGTNACLDKHYEETMKFFYLYIFFCYEYNTDLKNECVRYSQSFS